MVRSIVLQLSSVAVGLTLSGAQSVSSSPSCLRTQPALESPRWALLLRGGAFRDDEHSFCSPSLPAYKIQHNNTQQHLEYIVEAALKRGVESVDLFIATYDCSDASSSDRLVSSTNQAEPMNRNLSQTLLHWYRPYLKKSILADVAHAHQGRNMHAAFDMFVNYAKPFHEMPKRTYSHIIIFRLDTGLYGEGIVDHILQNEHEIPKILLPGSDREEWMSGSTHDDVQVIPWSLLSCFHRALESNWCFPNPAKNYKGSVELVGMGHCCCAALARVMKGGDGSREGKLHAGRYIKTKNMNFEFVYHPGTWEEMRSVVDQSKETTCDVETCEMLGGWSTRHEL